MSDKAGYKDYASDEHYMEHFSQYMEKFAHTVRESDKILIDLVAKSAPGGLVDGDQAKLLDIGCSNGNLLMHLKNALPQLSCTGVDMSESMLEEARKNPALEGFSFVNCDICEQLPEGEFDVITTNKVLCVLSHAEFERALSNMAKALKPGGHIISFEWYHPYEQYISITEATKLRPNGLDIYYRPYSAVIESLKNAGLENETFKPFTMPVEIPFSGDMVNLTTYTVKTDSGENMSFRGALYQPWCHHIARKPK